MTTTSSFLSHRIHRNRPDPAVCAVGCPDWSSFELQLRHAQCCHDAETATLLRGLHGKLLDRSGGPYARTWPAPENWYNYDVAATAVACSDMPYAKKFDYLRCGFEINGHRFYCKQPWLCPRCAYLQARKVSAKFAESFGQDLQVFGLTLSLSHDPNEGNRLIFRGLKDDDSRNIQHTLLAKADGASSYGIPVRSLDDAPIFTHLIGLFEKAVNDLTKRGPRQRITGGVRGREFGVRFTPTLHVLPHVHFTIWSPAFDADDALALLRRVRELMRNSRALNYERLGVRIYPSVACCRLGTREDLKKALRYSLKPILYPKAYINYAESVHHDPAKLQVLNQQANLLLRLVPIAFKGLPRYISFGACHRNSKGVFRVARGVAVSATSRDNECSEPAPVAATVANVADGAVEPERSDKDMPAVASSVDLPPEGEADLQPLLSSAPSGSRFHNWVRRMAAQTGRHLAVGNGQVRPSVAKQLGKGKASEVSSAITSPPSNQNPM